MSRRKPQKSINIVSQTLRQAAQTLSRLFQRLFDGILHRQLNLGRQRPKTNAGFILPTVVMVMLVVTLLVLTIVFRSFDRAKNASNVRVSQVALESASPAVARVDAKLKKLFGDARLPRSTPSDDALYGLLSNTEDGDKEFTYEDEVRLKLAYDLDGNGLKEDLNSPPALEKREVVNTAWRFPVDTDNNGKFDSFTVYSILFRSPELDTDGTLKQERQPLESRTPPMDEGVGEGVCAAAQSTSAKLVSQGGWYKSGSKLKKSFFVYTATVPITNIQELGLDSNTYENSTETQTFSALEYQQDQARIPLANYAVIFEDDLAMLSGTDLALNGSVIVNGNLFVTPTGNGSVTLLQVSAPESCFYTEENSKIFVGGHLINANPTQTTNDGKEVSVDLFIQGKKGSDNRKNLKNPQSQSTDNNPTNSQYNSQAYEARINRLVDKWIADKSPNSNGFHAEDPGDVKEAVRGASANAVSQADERQKALRTYFKERIRRVPYQEVAYGATDNELANANYFGKNDNLRPPKAWMFPYDPTNGKTQGGYAEIPLNTPGGNRVKPAATEPETLATETQENFVGDRILVGNNLPVRWYSIPNYGQYDTDNTGVFITKDSEVFQPIQNTKWNKDSTGTNNPQAQRGRLPQLQTLADVGDRSRSGFWEEAAATQPENKLDPVGGLRVITGAGVYERKNSFLPPPKPDHPNLDPGKGMLYDDPSTTNKEEFPVVWSDAMPMSPVTGAKVFDNVAQAWVDDPSTYWNSSTKETTVVPKTPTIDPTTYKFVKGDLRMRATAVYHYAQDVYAPSNSDNWQKPIACISNYYDPTNETTAKNTTSNPLKKADNAEKSNNGVVYSVNTWSKTLGGVSAPNSTTGLFPGTEDSNSLKDRLYYQANLVYPDGRFVNEPLRNALIALNKNSNDISLADQAAIDSTICSLEILSGGVSKNATFIPDGAIKETAFLNPRQVKTLEQQDERHEFTGEYDLAIEERQPLEIRATMLDLEALRKKEIDFANNTIRDTSPTTDSNKEVLLPISGIIYASRDDALPDISDAYVKSGTNQDEPKSTATKSELRISAVDYKLDPTRRPSAILLYNGEKLGRKNDNNEFKTIKPGEAEKGLTLVSNIPAYIWANTGKFNPHTEDEFVTGGTFYNRNNPNKDFACRKGDPRLNCDGDEWRPTNVLADAVGLLSKNFRFGFRNEGDFDLRNNADSYPYGGSYASYTPTAEARQKRKQNGFFDNNYATNGLSSYFQNGVTRTNLKATYNGGDKRPRDDHYTAQPTTNNDAVPSSYFTNFITPVQRRIQFNEYVMEVCLKLPVSACEPQDWVVGYDANENGTLDAGEPATETLAQFLARPPAERGFKRLASGTTARPPIEEFQRFPRRVAFERDANHQLQLTNIQDKNLYNPVPVGVDRDQKVSTFPYLKKNNPNQGTERDFRNTDPKHLAKYDSDNNYDTEASDKKFEIARQSQNNALWFRTTNNDNGQPFNDPEYGQNKWLSYLEEAPQDESEELLLPDVLPDAIVDKLTAANKTSVQNVASQLNRKGAAAETPPFAGNDDPSDYSLCVGKTTTPLGTKNAEYKFEVSPANPPQPNECDNSIVNAVNIAIDAINGIPHSATLSGADETLDAGSNLLNVYRFPNTNQLNGITLTLKGNQDSIFIFKPDTTSASPVTFDSVTLVLEGVNPNNIFWVANKGMAGNGMTFQGTNTLAGNFLGGNNTSVLTMDTGTTTTIQGGRILGFDTHNIDPLPANFKLNAVTYTKYHPLLVPVLQLQTAEGTDFMRSEEVKKTKWQIRAAESEFHVLFAGGNTPARPTRNVGGSQDAESDGGIANFPRIIESWFDRGDTSTLLKINGSMMEFERSQYATGPFRPTQGKKNNNGGPFNYEQIYNSTNGRRPEDKDHINGKYTGRQPYNEPPERDFGYDVGLLTQTPDLFSGRFTSPPAGDPDEFFREVSRDDDWIQTLLCAKVYEQNKTAEASKKAVNDNQRPTNFCTKKAAK